MAASLPGGLAVCLAGGAAAQSREGASPPVATAAPIVVDAAGGGHFASLREAMAAAPPGAHIHIRPGTYRESLTMDKPLHLAGVGESPGDVVIESRSGPCLRFDAEFGSLSRVTLRYRGFDLADCLLIVRGRLWVEDADLTSRTGSVISVLGEGTAPTVRRCRIHGGRDAGILVWRGAAGRYEDNDIFGNELAGIAVTAGGDPVAVGNRIHDNGGPGIDVFQGGRGRFERNEIFGNAQSGVSVKEGGDPALTENRIHGNREAGIWIHNAGRGRFDRNHVFDNAMEGIDVSSGTPTLTGNRIYRNGKGDLVIREEAAGRYEGNVEGVPE